MLRRLRRKFVAITMALVGVVLGAALCGAVLTSAAAQRALTRGMLEGALRGDVVGAPLMGEREHGPDVGSILTITVDVNDAGTVLARSDSPLDISRSALYDLVVEALSSDADEGESARYHVSWMRSPSPQGWRIALADTYARDASIRSQALSCLGIFLVCMGALLVVVHVLADWSLRPVRDAWDRQRRFVSDASHELKTPLAVILADTQILARECADDPEALRWASSASEEAKNMRDLVEDLLTLARADESRASGAAEPPTGRVDLSALVDGSALEFDAVAYERGCEIERDLRGGLWVSGDERELGRAMGTLLDNATKYADRGSVVRVRLRASGRQAQLDVTNQGRPIPPGDLEHVFDRFYRTDEARERSSHGGFGLGLAIAKSIVEGAGGTIRATSDASGQTTFAVCLPLAEAAV